MGGRFVNKVFISLYKISNYIINKTSINLIIIKMEKLSTTKSGSVLFTQDINESQLETLKKAK